MDKKNNNLENAVGHLLHKLTEEKGVHLDQKTKETVLQNTIKMLEEQEKAKKLDKNSK